MNIAIVRGRKDGLAFAATVAFAFSLYSSIVSVWPALQAARPALSTAALAALLLLLARIARHEPLSLDGIRGASLLALVAWSFISILWSYHPAISTVDSMELAKLAAIYLIMINLVNTPSRFCVIVLAAVIGSLAPSLGTIDQWRNGIDLVDGYRARWLGVYFDPNHLSMSLVAVVPIAGTLLVTHRSWLVRLLGAIAAGLAVTAIVLTHSRGGALGLALALVFWAVTGAKKMRNMAVVGAIFLSIVVFAPRSFFARTESLSTYEDDVSAHGRVWAWEVTAAINRDRPLHGVGVGAFVYAWPSYAVSNDARRARFVAHNVFLATIGELGMVGFGLFLIFVSGVLAGLCSAWKNPEIGPLIRALAAGFVGYVLCDLMSGYFLSAHFFFLAALGACAERCAKLKNSSSLEPAWPGQSVALEPGGRA